MILELLISWLVFLAGPFGFISLGLGLFTFLGLPLLSRPTGIKRLSNIHLWFGMWSVNRACLVLSEHGDLLFKKMKYVDLGVERVQMANDAKDFEDPAAALSHWMGFPFALADERDGVLFDPRHAAIAAKKHAYDERDMGTVLATDSDYDAYNVDEWLPGVFELPKTAHELVDLSAIHYIIGGGERAEYPQRIEKLYKLSRDPFNSGKEALRLLIPVAAFVGVVVLLWQISENMGAGGGGSSVGYGSAVLLLGLGSLDLKRVASVIVLTTIPIGILGAIFVFVNPLVAVFVLLTFGVGFLVIPTIAFGAKVTGLFGETLARKLFLKIGMLAYDTPIFQWTPRGYTLVEFDALDDVETVTWYSLLGAQVGFTYPPGAESFGPEVMDAGELSAHSEVLADGGADRLPSGYVRAPEILPSVYGGYVPDRLDDDTLYLNSGIALGKIKDAADGEKSMKRLLQSKEKYGGGTFGVSDKLLLYGTLAGMVFGSALGVFLFFL